MTSKHNHMLRPRTVHMVIHKCGQDSHHEATAYRRRHPGLALAVAARTRPARRPICHPRFVVSRRFGLKQHCEANSFPGARQPFCNIRKVFPKIARRTGGGCGVSKGSTPTRRPSKRGLTGRTAVSTLMKSPESRRYGCDPSTKRGGCAGYQARHKAYRGVVWASVTHRHGEPGRTRCQMQQGESRGKGQADLPAE